MDKKITIPAGIALMVVLAVAGMLAIFSYTAATPVQAAIEEDSLSYAGSNVFGESGEITITFTTGDAATDAIAVGGDIVITFPAEFTVTNAVPDLGAVTVNGAAATTAFAAGVVTVTVPEAIAEDSKVSVVIPNENATVADQNGITNPGVTGPYVVSVAAGGTTETVTIRIYDGQVDVVPNKPNKADDVVFSFYNADPIGAENYLVLVLQEKFTVPAISESDVSIRWDAFGSDRPFVALDDKGTEDITDDVYTYIEDDYNDGSKRAADVIVDDEKVFKVDKDDPLIFIEIPDMDTSDTGQAEANVDPIPGNVTVTVTIAKAAGIVAPTEAKTYKVAAHIADSGRKGRDDAKDLIAFDTADEDAEAEGDGVQLSEFILYHEQTLNRLITLSEEDGGRGDEVVATAKGWAGDTISFFVDGNGNGKHDAASEALLCNEVSNADNVAECTFTLGSELTGGHGTAGATGCDGTDEPNPVPLVNPAKCNLINAFDSENDYSSIHWEDDVIEVTTSISLSPAEGNPGEEIVVQIRDFPVGTAVSSVTIAGSSDNLAAAGLATDANGDVSITIEIPNVPSGTRLLTVEVGTGDAAVDDDTNIMIGGATILASPTSVLPNQRMNISAIGFSTQAVITSFSIGGYNMGNAGLLDAEDRRADSAGNWNGSINIPYVQTTVDGGDLTLVLTDDTFRTGSTTLNFRERTVTLTPAEGRVGSSITITGENFPALNDDGEDIDVEIKYAGHREDSVEPDSDGRWQSVIEVPRDEGIPSTNVIRVEFGRDETGFAFEELETFLHRVPRATVSLSPTSGPEGSMVTLTGEGFHRFQALESLEVGGNSALPSPAPSTNREGNVEVTFQVPGVESGSQNVVVEINDVTANVVFTVTEASGVVGAVTSSVDVALEPLLTAGTLDRVFYFNNATKEWQWHIVDPDFASTNNLNEVVSGAPMWVLVTEDTSVILNSRTVDFTCAGGDCWNLVTFP